jgi:hypothetical protein
MMQTQRLYLISISNQMVESISDVPTKLEEEPEQETLLVAPGEMEVKLTSLDIRLKASLEDRQKY